MKGLISSEGPLRGCKKKLIIGASEINPRKTRRAGTAGTAIAGTSKNDRILEICQSVHRQHPPVQFKHKKEVRRKKKDDYNPRNLWIGNLLHICKMNRLPSTRFIYF